MTRDQKIIRAKLDMLELAKQLGNVSTAISTTMTDVIRHSGCRSSGVIGRTAADQGAFSEAGFETGGGSRTIRATRKHSSAWGTPQ